MTVVPGTPTFDDKLPGDDPLGSNPIGKVSETDPRVQSWSTAEFKSDRLTVRFMDTVTLQEAEASIAAEAPGTTIKEWDDELKMAFLELPADSDEIDLGHRFLRMSNTLYAEPDFVLHMRATIPDDTFFPRQWALNNTGQIHDGINFPPPATPPVPAPPPPIGAPDADIDAPEAWDLTTGNPDVVVAILDSGVHTLNTDLQPNIWVNPRELPDLIDNDGNGYIDDYNGANTADRNGDIVDYFGHGTQMASIIGAQGNNSSRISGVSWNSKFMPVKISDTTNTITVTGAIGGYKYVQRMKQTFGVNIVAANASFGGSQYSFAEFDAVQKMTAAGILLVAAVDNTGVNHDIFRDYPSSYNINEIIAVSASDDADFPLANMNVLSAGFGRATVDIHAPGYEILALTLPYSDPGPPIAVYTRDVFTGTSFAAAHVTGIAALVNSLAPGLTALETKQYIMAGADYKSTLDFLSVSNARANARGALDAIPTNTFTGTVFSDANGNRVYDSIGENGLAGWTIYLDVDNDGVRDANEPSTMSAADGSYVLNAYATPGTYNLRQVPQPNFVQTAPNTNGGAHRVTLANRNVDFSGMNFGNRQQAGTIVGHKFNDLDADGVQDPGEPGIANITFYVDLNNNSIYNVGEPAAKTDANGNFVIPNIQPNTYSVREIITPGYLPTLPTTTLPNGLPDAVLTVTVTSNLPNDPPLLFGNRVARDWGDLPEGGAVDIPTYKTLSANGGPSHGILTGFMLGTAIDFETDGLPSSSALGDDQSPTPATGDDEDGVVFRNIAPGEMGIVDVRTTNIGRSAGLLHAWMDFNRDGDFDDAGEQIFKNLQLADGLNLGLEFPIPVDATTDDTYARFRYTYDRNIGPNGPAKAGEVEDYLVEVFTAGPTGEDDQFPDWLFPPPVDYPADELIKEGSVDNPLDVLRNDPLPLAPFDTLTIVASDFPKYIDHGNGSISVITVDTVNQVLLYTPGTGASPFTGIESFTYRVTNGDTDPDTGLPLISDEITVSVNVTAKDPRAVDDTFTIEKNTSGNPVKTSYTLPVLVNDVNTPSAPISLLTFTQPDYGFTVPTPTVVQVGNDLVITPPDDFTGTVQFSYTITDLDPNTADSTAQVTIQVTNVNNQPLDPDYQAKIIVRVFSDPGLTQEVGVDPSARIDVGMTFYVGVFAEDLRPGGSDLDRGVEAVFLDLLYDRRYAAAHLVESPLGSGNFVPEVIFNPAYRFFDENGIFGSPDGIVNEFGAVHDTSNLVPPNDPPFGTGEILIATLSFDAIASTPAPIEFRADPAEDDQDRTQILLAPPVGLDPPIPQQVTDDLVFLQASAPFNIKVVGAPEFVNEINALDVNADTKITAFDAISVINELNTIGTRRLSDYDLAIGGALPPTYYVDTNRDGLITAFDALVVINWLNAHPLLPSASAGEDVGNSETFAAQTSSVVSSFAAGEAVEESPVSSASSTPVLFALTPVSQGTLASESAPVGAVSNFSNDNELLYLSAVDQLMALTGEDDSDNADDSTDSSDAPAADWLSLGPQLRSSLLD
ncbi:Major intracellular serine protease precursor [Anatilimnocola aggregata]|uniref:Major intracellular serine protease n=1 Tax=Anatilimnocola aggregata TaxID=2528021 RepID=A0A517YHA9_9BACT|nr:S8 family serine peptidase [Anatilimnocola aggregata]QDU29592.1 Major intracellular serine protease precursor [Anatilimnocola aggregata]